MHNLRTVLGFELSRTLKKKSFWISAAMFPIAICLIFVIIYFSGQASDKAAEDTKNQQFSIELTDESGLLSPEAIKAVDAREQTDKAHGISDVKNGKVDAYFYYPKNLGTEKVEVYGKDVGLFNSGRYQGVAESLLKQAAASQTSPEVTAVLTDTVAFNSQTYKDGQIYDGFKQVILPGVFLLLFYILIVVFGNQMLTSSTEEKENRVIEMLLTSLSARTLVIGKIISLLLLGFIQVLVIVTPVVIIYLLFHNSLSLPEVDLSSLPIDPVRILVGALLFMLSFVFFTGLLVAIGASVPTAKEASGFFGAVMLFLFGPLYAVTLFISAPESGLVKFLSFFPLTAPIPLLLRNAVGNLAPWETALGIAILAVSAVLSLMIATRLFRYGALEYGRRLSPKILLRK